MFRAPFASSGCHLHPRCAHAIDRCRIERPALIADQSGHATACHRWRELPAMPGLTGQEAPAPRLERLMAEFTRKPDVRAAGGVDTLNVEDPAARLTAVITARGET